MNASLFPVLSNEILQKYAEDALLLLKKLIATPSFSKEENATADIIEDYLKVNNIPCHRVQNNVWASNQFYDQNQTTLLLNSHHDTVKPNAGYTLNPFDPVESNDRLFGLGSNDAGGCLVSLLICFVHFYAEKLPFNLLFAASAEEEISGKNGMELLLTKLPGVDFAIVGEPTGLQMAVAEKGLLVLDAVAPGRAGHAARDEAENAIYTALQDIGWIRDFTFPKVSDLLGQVHMAVTSIQTANKAHNMVPDSCHFVVDVRVNELYSFEEVLAIIKKHVKSSVSPRSNRLKPSGISPSHPLVRAGIKMGLASYGSPTLSDMALMDFPALKLGPGESARSHSADEFIYLEEIEKGIATYIGLLENLAAETREENK